MNLQIIGTKKCRDTQKSERFFKERKIPYHFRDLNEKGLAKGELDNILSVIPLDELIDKDGQQYKKRNMQFMVFDIEEELLQDPLLLRTPVIRNGKQVTIGYQPEIWTLWLKHES
ncbi:MAG: ArsC family transcriptional regulator [Ignavibacterium sp.]|nr:ArsC family transcriptional regulator [Ignavibacterium sp.]